MEMDIDIKILGPGCKKCIQVAEIVRQVIEEHSLLAQIEEISSVDKIAEFGVLSTPAVVIGGDVKCTGRVPESHEILLWLRKYQGTSE